VEIPGARAKERFKLGGAIETRQVGPDIATLKAQEASAGGVEPDNPVFPFQEDDGIGEGLGGALQFPEHGGQAATARARAATLAVNAPGDAVERAKEYRGMARALVEPAI
jgi:hypothetical protein